MEGEGFDAPRAADRDNHIERDRALGLSAHPGLMSLKMVAAMILVWSFRNFSNPRVVTTFFIGALTSLLLTFTRTGWAVFMLWMAVVAWNINSARLRILLIVFGLPLFVLMVLMTGRLDDLSTMSTFIKNESYRSFDYRLLNNTFEWRLVQWYDLFSKAMERVWIGHGPGTVAELNVFEKTAHNSLLDIFVEQGAIGLTAFLVFTASIVINSGRALKKLQYETPSGSQLKVSWIAICLGYLAAMTFGMSVFNQTLNMLYLLLFLGLIVSPRLGQLLVERDSRYAHPTGPDI
jgi:O-antigen ligase